jgi:hypothetical protein
MKKRFISGLIFICLVLGVFAGCGKTTDTATDIDGLIAETSSVNEVTEVKITDYISEEDWEKALDAYKIIDKTSRATCRPVMLNGELYIASATKGMFYRVDTTRPSTTTHPMELPFPTIHVTINVDSYQNGFPLFNKPEYIFGSNYDELTYVAQEMKDAAIELTGINTSLTREINADEYNIDISFENANFCNIIIETGKSITDFLDAYYIEPMVTVNTKNLNNCKIEVITERVNLDVIDFNNQMSFYYISGRRAGRVSFTPTKTATGRIYFQASNVENYTFMPNECINSDYMLSTSSIKNVHVVTDEVSENPSQNITAELVIGGQQSQCENLYFTLGNDDDNSVWNISTSVHLLAESSVVFALTTNECGTVSFGSASQNENKGIAALKPNATITINKDMFWDFIQKCDPTKTYLWDHETNRATEVVE